MSPSIPDEHTIECRRCGACCRIHGFVRVSGDEINAIAAFLSVGEREFIHRFTRLSRNRAGLELVERENGECVFLQGAQCRIQQVKPQQCRTFPDGWRYPGVEEICPAYRPGITNPNPKSQIPNPKFKIPIKEDIQ